MKAYSKDIVKEIKKSKGRFVSILLIVAIGVAFFTGITTAAPIMRENVDRYYDITNYRDLELLSTFGFEEKDLTDIRKLDYVSGAYGQKVIDVYAKNKDTRYTIRVNAIPSNLSQENQNYIDQYRVIEGRLPQNKDEAVLKVDSFGNKPYVIGEVVTLYLEDDEINDTLSNTTYTIVGYVESPNLLNVELGTSNLGNGSIHAILGIYEDNFSTDYYTGILVRLFDTTIFDSFSQEYLDFVGSAQEKIKDVGQVNAAHRFEKIKNDAQLKLAEAELLYIENKQIFDDGIALGKTEIANQQATLNQGLAALQEGRASALLAIDNGILQIDQALLAITTSYQTVLAQEVQFTKDKIVYEQQITTLNVEVVNLQNQLTNATDPSIITNLQLSITQKQQAITQIQTLLTNTQNTIAQTKIQVESTKNGYDKEREKLLASKSQLEETFSVRQQELYVGQRLLNDAQAKILAQEQEGLLELKKASNEIDNAKSALSNLEAPEWFVLTRDQNYSYVDYHSATQQMDSIAKVFPLFFILVAALVCLTTMTRMVDEQRGYIGTLKALGYSNGVIVLKYMLYAALAGILGSILGASIGMNVFPVVVYNAWGMMYTLPSITLTYDLQLAFTAMIFFTTIIVLSTLFASISSLREEPASLMRPKAPSKGKRILLERVGFVWKRLTFSDKVTARNIFRYKKRFFMSILGIAGCFALLLAGFGIRDSISGLVEKQFMGIQTYEGEITLQEKLTNLEKNTLYEELSILEGILDTTLVTTQQAITSVGAKDQSIGLFSFSNHVQIQNYFNLQSTSTRQSLVISDSGVLISEKLAKLLEVNAGDTMSFNVKDSQYTVTIAGVFTNYVNHYMLFSDSYYEEIFKQIPSQQTILFNSELGTAVEEKITSAVNLVDEVSSISFYSKLANSFDSMLESLNIIVLVLIISAGLLAFVVLYNLTTVNVSERMREIATIKVLGFYNKEVETYVFKENIILTIIGSFVGMILGIILHQFIMNIVEQDTIIFDKVINVPSYLLSFVITLFFAFLVNVSMKKTLHRIAMVESLKSVE